MSEGHERDQFMSKEERDRLWRELGERNERSRKLARGEAPPPRDYEIVVNADGNEMVVCPWYQELPPLGAEIFFWNILEELRSNLSADTQNEFLVTLGKHDEQSKSLLNAFCDFALTAAKDAARERHRARMQDIDDVRQSVGFYDEKDETVD